MGWIKQHISSSRFHTLLSRLSVRILENRKEDFDFLYGIPRGGLVPAVYLSHALDIPLWTGFEKQYPKRLLVVDDIADTGKTLLDMRLNTPSDMLVRMATVFYKRRSVVEPDFYEEVTDKWIVFPWEDVKEKPNRNI